MRAARLTLVFSASVAFAQFPGQYPGQSPLPGGNPGGYPGGRRPQQQQQQPDSRQSSTRSSSRPVALTTDGILRRASSNQVVIEGDDHRIIWYRLTDKTTVQKDGRDTDLKNFQVADHVTVESVSDDQDYFVATAVTWNKAGTPEEKGGSVADLGLARCEQRAACPSLRNTELGEGRRRSPDPAPEEPGSCSICTGPTGASITTCFKPADACPYGNSGSAGRQSPDHDGSAAGPGARRRRSWTAAIEARHSSRPASIDADAEYSG